jgi:hypothetical protein
VSGSAVDVVGPGLGRYVANVRRQGGWAVLENKGGVQHAHADHGDPVPSGRGSGRMAVTGGGMQNIFHITAYTQLDYEKGLENALERVQRHHARRAYDPVWDRQVAN